MSDSSNADYLIRNTMGRETFEFARGTNVTGPRVSDVIANLLLFAWNEELNIGQILEDALDDFAALQGIVGDEYSRWWASEVRNASFEWRQS